MAATSGIGWTDATVNFVIGCAHAGPGCDGCYAEDLAGRRFGVTFGPGQERRVTKSGFADPLKWQRMHDQGKKVMVVDRKEVRVPLWVFACSLSDFFDNEWPEGVRDRAWEVIKQCRSLNWQIVTKRVGNVSKMLPRDWDGGPAYDHVGIIATMVNQAEVDRDINKLWNLKAGLGVKWIGLSIEPQIGGVVLGKNAAGLDWVITGGESAQGNHPARPYEMQWTHDLIAECAGANVPIFVKQMGDNPVFRGRSVEGFRSKGSNPIDWPVHLRVQQMPRIYDRRTLL